MRFLILLLFLSIISYSYTAEGDFRSSSNKNDIDKQYSLLKNCAENNDFDCQFKLFKLVIENQPLLNEYFDYAFDNLINAGVNNHVTAQFVIGTLYQGGLFVKKDADASLTWLLAAANSGHQKAQYMAGRNYSERIIESENAIDKNRYKKQAIEWLSKASKSGYLPATRHWGSIMLQEDINSKDGIDLLLNAADGGDKQALRLLAITFTLRWRKTHKNSDFENALVWYQKAIESGDNESTDDLANLIIEQHKLDSAITN